MDVEKFSQLVQPELSPLTVRDRSAATRIWECRTLNSHRAVIYLDERTRFSSTAEVQTRLRDLLSSALNLRWIWLRGFAYGVYIHAPNLPDDAELLEQCVDIYNNSKGTLQWLVFVSDDPAIAFGIHTWAEVKLSLTYRNIIAAIETGGGPRCQSFVRDKGAFFEFVTKLRKNPLQDFNRPTH